MTPPPEERIPETLAARLADVIRRSSVPLEPQPTGVEPQLEPLAGIRAVLFDVYGTLFVSGSGDVGTTDVDSKPAAFGEAFEAVGLNFTGDSDAGVRLLQETIAAHHARERQRGIEYPEVEIRDVWADVVTRLVEQGSLDADSQPAETTHLALEYEIRTNPVWPMPHAGEVIRQLGDASMILGIVSNAQVFTRLLFPTLLERSLDDFGFDPELCVWSYEHRQAKPGTFLYERAAEELTKRGIVAQEVLFVGNDMLKDIWAASGVGFRTALFAGDARSYRPRTDDERTRDIRPDLVLTNLAQLPECVRTD